MDFRLMPWAHFYKLHTYFRSFHWLHPRLQQKLPIRVLSAALKEGHLFECERRPWLVASPAFLFALRGQAPSGRQWKRLQKGPAAHESLILRTAAQVWDWPGVRIRVDEAIQEDSLPGAWGGLSQIVPDIEITFDDLWLPRIWVECERTLRQPEHYAKRLARIPGHLVFYVVHSERQRVRMVDRLGLAEIPRKSKGRVRVFTEAQWSAFARRYGRKLGVQSDTLRLQEGRVLSLNQGAEYCTIGKMGNV